MFAKSSWRSFQFLSIKPLCFKKTPIHYEEFRTSGRGCVYKTVFKLFWSFDDSGIFRYKLFFINQRHFRLQIIRCDLIQGHCKVRYAFTTRRNLSVNDAYCQNSTFNLFLTCRWCMLVYRFSDSIDLTDILFAVCKILQGRGTNCRFSKNIFFSISLSFSFLRN